MALINPWMLEDYQDTLDTAEIGEAGSEEIQIRHHYTFARYRKVSASVFGPTSEVGKSTGVLTYNVGSVTRTKSFVGSASAGRKYICVFDGLVPEQPGTPGEWMIQRQVWEFYSKYEAAPAGWGV